MEIKTINYQRVLNLGNYESKRLEMFAELNPGDDFDAETTNLMEEVERKIREDVAKQYEDEISNLKQQLRELKQEVKQQLEQSTTAPNTSTDPGDAW